MTAAAFWSGVVPVVYLVSVPVVLLGVLVFVVALCRGAAQGDAVLSERAVAAAGRPRSGDVVVWGAPVDLDRLDDELQRLLARGEDVSR